MTICWSPFATNVLDANKYDLCLPDLTPVHFSYEYPNFILVIGDKRYVADSNLQMSYLMNANEVGCVRKS